MKKIIAIALAIISLLPAAAITSQAATGPVPLSAAGSDNQSGAELMPAEEMIKDEELINISGQSLSGPLPWKGLIAEGEMVSSRIKLWDEADRSLQIEVSRGPGPAHNSTWPAAAGKAFTGF